MAGETNNIPNKTKIFALEQSRINNLINGPVSASYKVFVIIFQNPFFYFSIG